MKGDQELIPDDRKFKLMDNGTLMVADTDETDDGFYECLAKNPEGEVRSRRARMVVHDGPSEDKGVYGGFLRIYQPDLQPNFFKYLRN